MGVNTRRYSINIYTQLERDKSPVRGLAGTGAGGAGGGGAASGDEGGGGAESGYAGHAGEEYADAADGYVAGGCAAAQLEVGPVAVVAEVVREEAAVLVMRMPSRLSEDRSRSSRSKAGKLYSLNPGRHHRSHRRGKIYTNLEREKVSPIV